MVIDKFNRPLKGIRISITQRCNLDCIYCHREGESEHLNREMITDEIIKILKLSVNFGIKKVKFTGGEPLLREDLPEIIKKTKKIDAINDISVVTNGVLLKKYAEALCIAGLNRINISLDTLNPKKYAKITNCDGLLIDLVKEGISEAVNCGISPIKLNMVVMKGINENEVQDVISFAKKKNLILQLIELVPMNKPDVFKQYHLELSEIEEYLDLNVEHTETRDDQNRTKYYLFDGAEIEVVKPFHNSEFCANCHRIRITSTGMIKPCLMRNNNLVDILTPLRNGASNEELSRLFQKAIDLREPYCR